MGLTTVHEAREALLAEADFRADMAPMLDALIAAVRAESLDGARLVLGLVEAHYRAESAETLRALREAAQKMLDAFDEYGGFDPKEWPEMDPLRAALAATPAEDSGNTSET